MTINNRTILSSLLVLSLFALGGCEEKKTEEWYMAHHDELLRKVRISGEILLG